MVLPLWEFRHFSPSAIVIVAIDHHVCEAAHRVLKYANREIEKEPDDRTPPTVAERRTERMRRLRARISSDDSAQRFRTGAWGAPGRWGRYRIDRVSTTATHGSWRLKEPAASKSVEPSSYEELFSSQGGDNRQAYCGSDREGGGEKARHEYGDQQQSQ